MANNIVAITPDLPVPWVRLVDGLVIITPAALKKIKPEKKG